MANKLILRSKNSPYTGQFADIKLGKVLSHENLDDNFIYLKGSLIYTGTTSGTILTLDKIDGTNFDIDLSSLISAGDTYTTGATLNGTDLDFDRNDILSAYTVDLSSFIDDTNSYTTGSTLIGTTAYFDRTDSLSAYTLDLNDINFTGNTSATCITDLYVTNVYGCSPITVHDSIQSTSGISGNDKSIAWGDNVIVSGTNQPQLGSIIVTGITMGISNTWGVNAIQIAGNVEADWLSIITNAGGSLVVSLYGGADPLETFTILEATYDFIASTDLGNYGGPPDATGTTHTTLSANNITQIFIDDNAYGFGKDIILDADGSMAVGSNHTVTGDRSFTSGDGNVVSGARSFTSGLDNTVNGDDSLTSGSNIAVNGPSAYAFGDNITMVSSPNSFSVGQWLTNTGEATYVGGKGIGTSKRIEGDGDVSFIHSYNTLAGGAKGVDGDYSAILTGQDHFIDTSSSWSAIIAGHGNVLTGTDRSVILGGLNITGTTSDTVYVPNLNINSGTTANTVTDLLVRDTDGTVSTRNISTLTLGSSGISGDTYVSGATLNGTNLDFDRNDSLSAFTVGLNSLLFTGNTSGGCISDIYVSNIHSCSPLFINPLDEGNVYVGGNSGFTVEIGTGDTKIGINKANPSYSLHIETGDAYVKNGALGVGEAPDPTQRVRVTQTDAAGNSTTGLRIDHSYQTATGTLSVLQVRSVPDKSGSNSTLFGVNSLLGGGTSDVTSGTHTFVAGRFKVQFAESGGTANNYALQLEDGSEGTIGHVLTSVAADGKANWAAVGSSGISGDTYVSGATLNGTDLDFDRNDSLSAFTVSLSGIIQQKYSASVAFTAATSQTITHSLNDTDVIVQLKDSTGVLIIPDVVNNYVSNSVDIQVSSTETYRVIIIG